MDLEIEMKVDELTKNYASLKKACKAPGIVNSQAEIIQYQNMHFATKELISESRKLVLLLEEKLQLVLQDKFTL